MSDAAQPDNDIIIIQSRTHDDIVSGALVLDDPQIAVPWLCDQAWWDNVLPDRLLTEDRTERIWQAVIDIARGG